MSRYVSPAWRAELAARKAANAAERAVMVNPFKVGDVMVDVWGYDQTNADFYEVVAVTARTVTLRSILAEITPTGDMTARARPARGVRRFQDGKRGEPFRKTLQPYPGHEPYIKSTYGWMRRYDGKEISTSSYA